MKNYIYTIFISMIVLMIQSCTTYTKFTVYGVPGTEIMTPDKTKLATVDNSGKAKIKNDDDNYYAFLLSHMPGSEEYVPFALDYKNKSYIGSKTAYCVGLGLAALGTTALLIGGIALAGGDEDVSRDCFLVGIGLDALGMPLGMPANLRSDQTNHMYRYKYLPKQYTNQDLILTKPNLVTAKPTVSTVSPTKQQDSSASTKKIGSSVSTKNLKDNAAKLEGTYVGSGNLKSGKDIVEDYTGIQVVITKKTKDIVLVNVYESDGSKFFASDGEYTIQKLSNGKYSLALNGIKNATIEIDTQNNLIYLHPRVNIDNEIYTLSIKAKKN